MSSPSYLLSRPVPMKAYLSGCSGSKGIFFVSLAGLNEPSASDSLGSGDISSCLPAIATTRSRSRFSATITRDSANRLLSAVQADDFLWSPAMVRIPLELGIFILR